MVDRALADRSAPPVGWTDDELMRRALLLAERGRGLTSPNPLVGAVIVSRDGVIVGSGFHERAGGPHAEVHALRAAGVRAKDATLYCSLEPCCHTGRTGPCAVAIAEAKIARVVAAVEDPNPRVAGGGFGYLRDHGVQVTTGVRRVQARRLNEVFEVNMRLRRPFITVKRASSLDGRAAAAPGARTAITSVDTDRHAHRVRAEVDAIGVGSETLLVDDPLLTARGAYRERPLARVVFDRRLRTSPRARVFGTLAHGPVFIVTDEEAVLNRAAAIPALTDAGATIVTPTSGNPGARGTEGVTVALKSVMAALLSRGVTSLLIEGGPRLQAACCEAGVVDRVRCYVGPHALGPDGVPWGMPRGCSLGFLGPVRARTLGDDVLIEADVHRID